MKNQILKTIAVIFITANLFSCKKSSTVEEPTSSFVLLQEDLQGQITDGIVTLKSGVTYKLTGPLIVKNNATLKIEPGAIIQAQTDKGSSNLYINIERTGKIDAQGTASEPILFTSTGTTMGSWGGICIHGQAPNNVGENAASEINGTQYGGSIANDNSGIMRYCIIKNTGAKNGDKEFNGISFFSVGSASIFEYIAIYNGGDDAFEWYGGTVNANYLYAENNDDDNFDYDLGYVGTLNYLYSINSNTNASSDSRGIEADNHPNSFSVTPFSNPTISNVSIIGRGSAFAGTQKEGIYLRRGVKSKISNVFLQGYTIGVGVEHNETLSNLTNGELKVTTIQMNDITTKTKGKKTDGTSSDVSSVITEGTTTGAGSGAAKPAWASFSN
jgi:hypothetical protein